MNLEDLYRLLRSGHVQAQGIVDTIDEPLVVLDERSVVLDANRAFFATFLVERDDTIGASLYSLGNGQWNIPELKRLVAEIIPKSAAVLDYEVTHAFPVVGSRTFLLTARRLAKPDNNSTHILLVFTDVTEDRDRERKSSLLYSELRHRLVNLLGVVQALANQTETTGRTAEEYKASFLGRFQALAKAQALMTSGSASVDFATLLSHLLSSLQAEQLVMSGGPPVMIADNQMVPLAMIVSELATNAYKYGALAQQGGTVEVSWQVNSSNPDERSLHFAWRETCSSSVPSPQRTGTGIHIIEELTAFSLHGKVELEFDSGGLRADLVFPLLEVQ